MAGISVSSVKNFPSVNEHLTFRVASTATTGYTTLASGANGYTDLGVCFPEELVIVGAWFTPDAVPASTAGLALAVAGGYSNPTGVPANTYAAVTAPTGALADANRASQTATLTAADGWTAGQLKGIPLHYSPGTTNSSTGSNLNNNVVPPGGRIYAYTGVDASGLTYRGTLVLRVETNRR